MSKIYRIIIIAFVLILSVNTYSQAKFQDVISNMSWGGNLGMSFGSSTYIQIAPVLYYNVNEDFVLGGGLDYTYYSTQYASGYKEAGSIWSPRLFARYFIVDDFFVHAEYQQYYSPEFDYFGNKVWTWSQPYYYAGGGYRQWMGQNSYMFVMLLFDLRNDELNFGINPRVQMGFAAGF